MNILQLIFDHPVFSIVFLLVVFSGVEGLIKASKRPKSKVKKIEQNCSNLSPLLKERCHE